MTQSKRPRSIGQRHESQADVTFERHSMHSLLMTSACAAYRAESSCQINEDAYANACKELALVDKEIARRRRRKRSLSRRAAWHGRHLRKES